MLRRILVISVGIVFLASTLVYAGGRIVSLSYNREEVRIKISVDNKGGWLGCSFFTSHGREYLDAKYVVGEDVVVYTIPHGAYKCEVALYRENWNRGDGPDPENAWGIKNGYYLWNVLSRDSINFSK